MFDGVFVIFLIDFGLLLEKLLKEAFERQRMFLLEQYFSTSLKEGRLLGKIILRAMLGGNRKPSNSLGGFEVFIKVLLAVRTILWYRLLGQE